jgi:hypothetical protein
MKRAAIAAVMAVILVLITLPSPVLATDPPTLTGISGSTGGMPNPTTTQDVPGVILTGTNFIDVNSINLDGSGVTVFSFHVDNSTQITATFRLAAGAAAGTRKISVTTTFGTTTENVQFTVNAYFTINIPATLNLIVMAVGISTGNTNGSVSTNVASWSVTAKDDTGYMKNISSNAPLNNKFEISKDNNNFVDSDSGHGIEYDGNPATLPFYVSQQVTVDDAPGAYTITITFTGSY